jgi:hypothetical protein
MTKSAQEKYETQQNLLSAELKALRVSVRESAESFMLCKEGEIENLLDSMLKLSPRKLKSVALLWTRELRDLKLKPQKGRIKDLKKLDAMLESLSNHLIEIDETTPKKAAPRTKKATATKTGVKPAAKSGKK